MDKVKNCSLCDKEFTGMGRKCSACIKRAQRERLSGIPNELLTDGELLAQGKENTEAALNALKAKPYGVLVELEVQRKDGVKEVVVLSEKQYEKTSLNETIAQAVAQEKEQRFKLIPASQIPDITYVPTGFPELDKITQFPRKAFTEIYGRQGVGKTSLVLTMIAKMSEENKVLYIDVENAFNPKRAKELGVNLDNLVTTPAEVLEEIMDLVYESIPQYDVIIIDSVAAALPRAEYEGETGAAIMGVKAKLMNSFCRVSTYLLAKSKCAIICINQQRESMQLYGPKYYNPGGAALPYAAWLRIEMVSNQVDRKKDGQMVTAKITKSKVCRPFQEVRIKIKY